MKWRLISDLANDAYTNMAIDEAILRLGKPTLRLYEWSPAAVSIGYFQSLSKEVETDICKKMGIDIVRRITGGGAVFHEHELTYSFICPEKYVPKDIIKSYHLICGAIVGGLTRQGIAAVFHPINDIIVNGKKISGSAQTRKNHVVLQHGTIIIDVDIDKMFSILKVPDEKMRDKMITTVKERVTSLSNELTEYDISALRKNIVRGFESSLKTEFEPGSLSNREEALAQELRLRFASTEWNRMR